MLKGEKFPLLAPGIIINLRTTVVINVCDHEKGVQGLEENPKTTGKKGIIVDVREMHF